MPLKTALIAKNEQIKKKITNNTPFSGVNNYDF